MPRPTAPRPRMGPGAGERNDEKGHRSEEGDAHGDGEGHRRLEQSGRRGQSSTLGPGAVGLRRHRAVRRKARAHGRRAGPIDVRKAGRGGAGNGLGRSAPSTEAWPVEGDACATSGDEPPVTNPPRALARSNAVAMRSTSSAPLAEAKGRRALARSTTVRKRRALSRSRHRATTALNPGAMPGFRVWMGGGVCSTMAKKSSPPVSPLKGGAPSMSS